MLRWLPAAHHTLFKHVPVSTVSLAPVQSQACRHSPTTNRPVSKHGGSSIANLADNVSNVVPVIHHFDKLYREIKKETADPNGNIFVDTQFDPDGRKWKVSNPYRSGESVLWTTTAYDTLDRPVSMTAPDSSTVQYLYQDNQTTVTDEAGN